LRVDLHCHTNASDGALSPAALCERALERSVDLLAITDHDTLAGYREARDWLYRRAGDSSLQLLPGIEYSSVWQGVSVHVVGLGFGADHPVTLAAEEFFQRARRERAQLIGDRLARLGMPGASEGALALAGASQVGRPHFARCLVERGYVATVDEAFDRFLGAGKVGDVQATWPALAQVVAWVKEAGGTAVLAHPLKYKLTAAKLRRLVTAFAAAGGAALEVLSGRPAADGTAHLVRLCRDFGLEASVGSDFHAPGPFWSDLGDNSALPPACVPVWRRWS
jgi:predicted metal-dependent phosphoesterase TrpH